MLRIEPQQKHTITTQLAAKSLHDKICAAHGKIAVFARAGQYISTKITTERFENYMRSDRKRDLMGVYDSDCMIAWLEDDLAYMGMK